MIIMIKTIDKSQEKFQIMIESVTESPSHKLTVSEIDVP